MIHMNIAYMGWIHVPTLAIKYYVDFGHIKTSNFACESFVRVLKQIDAALLKDTPCQLRG